MHKWYQKHRKFVAFLYGITYVISCYLMLLTYIPKEISIEKNTKRISLAAPVLVDAFHSGDVLAVGKDAPAVGVTQTLRCKLFGVIPVGTIRATVTDSQKVSAVGSPVGIYLKMKNVYVAGIKDLADASGNTVTPGAYVVKEGDYITGVNGKMITTKEQLQSLVSQSEGEPLILTILRNDETMDVKIQPVLTDGGIYRIGLWVKDDMAGVGTMTYIKSNGEYGALGHGISDSGSGELLLLDYGYLYRASITSVTPSSIGSPGEITGMIAYGSSTRVGDVDKNSAVGIFGDVSSVAKQNMDMRTYPVGYKQDLQRDAATMLFGTEGNVRTYQIAIDSINYEPKEKNKAFVFHVTEKSLIEKMGGIVQGMSGSPIIQNGKIVGAVTHVFVNDPTKGYGIFIEDMLDQ